MRGLYLRYLSKNSTTVAHVGVYGFGFSTAQPFESMRALRKIRAIVHVAPGKVMAQSAAIQISECQYI
jgi:dienelactone hydrolase